MLVSQTCFGTRQKTKVQIHFISRNFAFKLTYQGSRCKVCVRFNVLPFDKIIMVGFNNCIDNLRSYNT